MQNKIKASLIHLLISLAVISSIYLLATNYWFPGATTSAMQALSVFTIILVADLIIGPVLTFVIYNNNKARKELSIDLSIIATLQIIALSYGLSIIHQQRPALIYYFAPEETFFILTKEDLNQKLNGKLVSDEIANELKLFSPTIRYMSKNTTADDDIRYAVDIQASQILGNYQLDSSTLHPIPTELEPAQQVLRHSTYKDDTASCIKRNIKYQGFEGTICYNPATQKFTNYSLAPL